MGLAKAAAKESLEKSAGKGAIALGDALVASSTDAWTFTWQGNQGGYIVTVRVDKDGQVKVLQSKAGVHAGD